MTGAYNRDRRHIAVHVSARTDYAVRAMLSIAAVVPGVVTAAGLAAAQGIPLSFLQGILLDLRRSGLIRSICGAEWRLPAGPADHRHHVGDVLRAVIGDLTTVRGLPPQQVAYQGAALGLVEVWRSVDGAITGVVDHTTLADLLKKAASQ
jgi:Rrf2 family protein